MGRTQKREHCPDCGQYRWNHDHTICLVCEPLPLHEAKPKYTRKREVILDHRDRAYYQWLKTKKENGENHE